VANNEAKAHGHSIAGRHILLTAPYNFGEQVCRNVKRWRDARMALRWTATAMLEAEKSFRRLKAPKQLPILRARNIQQRNA
jgi:hypothetical protein